MTMGAIRTKRYRFSYFSNGELRIQVEEGEVRGDSHPDVCAALRYLVDAEGR